MELYNNRTDRNNEVGIVIDDRLRFKDHYDYMLKKIGKNRVF